MQHPAFPPNEERRLQALAELGILNDRAEARFDRYTRMASQIFQTPIALISLVDADRLWFKSRQGLDAHEMPRHMSFCADAILGDEFLIVEDALKDARFAAYPQVTGAPHIRFYAGAPLATSSGPRVGTLCIMDRQPRRLGDQARGLLRDLADCLEAELEKTLLAANAEQSTRLALVAEHIDNAVIITDAWGVIEWVNQGFERTSGYTLAEVRGKKPGALLQGPATDPATVAFMREKIRAGEACAAEVLNYRKDGNPYWVALSIQPLHNGADLTGFIAIERDVSRRKQNETDLTTSENRLRAIIDTVVDGVVTIDDTGFIHTFNPAAERIFGYAADEIIGRKVNVLMPEPYRREHDGYLNHYLTTGERRVIGIGREVTGMRKDGTTFPMELAVSEMQVNEARMFTGIVRDITERKQTEGELNLFKNTLDQTQDAILMFWPDTLRFFYANQGAMAQLGYNADELLQMTPVDLKPLFDEAGFRQLLAPLIEGEENVITFETIHRRKDGQDFPVEIVLQYMASPGEVPRFINIVRDISERKRIERMKSEFISTVSHELRTPLTSIRGALGLVLGKASSGLSDKARQLLKTANRNSERLTLLINDILDLEKIESGRLEFEFKPVDLTALTHQALAANEGYAHQHRVSLRLIEAPERALVQGDEHRLLQVFANLLSNAVKYSPAEGYVDVSIHGLGGHYRVGVKDQGKGIEPSFRNRIFQRFAQADSSDTREKGGTGLGLSITKAIVEKHGGSIDYNSEEGMGSEFFFEIPAWREVVTSSGEKADNRSLLLICEDNSDVAAVLSELLSDEGVVTDIAATASATKRLLSERPYRALILDLSLPDMDGLALIAELREQPATRNLPIIVVSGRAAEGRATWTGDALAVVDWLQKPVDQRRLSHAVQQLLHREKRPSILHVEDDMDILQVMQALLEDVGDYEYVSSLAAARARLSAQSFDLVLLDLTLPDGSGLELIDELNGKIPVVVFSGQETSGTLSQQVAAALTKSRTSNEQFLATIRQVLHH